LENGVDEDAAYDAYMNAIMNEGDEEGDEELDLGDCEVCMAQPNYTECWTTCEWAD